MDCFNLFLVSRCRVRPRLSFQDTSSPTSQIIKPSRVPKLRRDLFGPICKCSGRPGSTEIFENCLLFWEEKKNSECRVILTSDLIGVAHTSYSPLNIDFSTHLKNEGRKRSEGLKKMNFLPHWGCLPQPNLSSIIFFI